MLVYRRVPYRLELNIFTLSVALTFGRSTNAPEMECWCDLGPCSAPKDVRRGVLVELSKQVHQQDPLKRPTTGMAKECKRGNSVNQVLVYNV